jgi:hypothetical protein
MLGCLGAGMVDVRLVVSKFELCLVVWVLEWVMLLLHCELQGTMLSLVGTCKKSRRTVASTGIYCAVGLPAYLKTLMVMGYAVLQEDSHLS